MRLCSYTLLTFIVFCTVSSVAQSTLSSKTQFYIHGGAMFFSRNESPAILLLMKDRFVSPEQTSSTGIDPSNDQPIWIEFSVNRPLYDKINIEGRIAYRNFNEDEFVVFQEGSNNSNQTSLIYRTSETHISTGLSIDYNCLELSNGFYFKSYLGLDLRKAQLTWNQGLVQYASPFSIEYHQFGEVLRQYDVQSIFVDPLVGLAMGKDRLQFNVRFQRFVKNKFEGENNFFSDYQDTLWMTSLGLGVSF